MTMSETKQIETKNSKNNNNKKCDVCFYGDGHKTLKLLRCTDCGLRVHRDCYGMPTYIHSEFICWACQAKGKTVIVNDPIDRHKKLSIIQAERPRKCDLCGHDDHQIHAMHPIYDNYGNKARQLHTHTTDSDADSNGNGNGNRRLVWAHTLCGFFLSTRNLLYSTTRQGTTHEGEESDPDDDRSVNPDLDDSSSSEEGEEDEQQQHQHQDKYQGFAPSHHFVWHRERKWTKIIQEHQLALTCDICHLSDYSSKPQSRCFRIPVQCSANDKTEYAPFRSTHTQSLADDQSCTLSYHVGCAAYANRNNNGSNTNTNTNNTSSLRQVFYFPGLPNDDSLEPIQCMYCPLHALDVNSKASQQRQLQQETQQQKARNKRKRAMMEHQKLAPLTLDQYSVHESTTVQQQDHLPEAVHDTQKQTLLDRIKDDLAEKVIHVTRETSRDFIKEQKKLWQRVALAEMDMESNEFTNLWKEAKAHANQVWKQHQQEK